MPALAAGVHAGEDLAGDGSAEAGELVGPLSSVHARPRLETPPASRLGPVFIITAEMN